MPYAQINGANLWYEVRGEGEPLLLHHGYTASRVNWWPVAQRLESKYQVVLMECRGTGSSEHTASGYTLEQYAADVVGLLDHLELESVTFAGHSMGGGIGFLLGLDHAARLDRLILMASIPSGGTGEIPDELRAQRLEERRTGDRNAILERYRTTRFHKAETDGWFESRADHILGVSDGHFEGSAEAMSTLNVSGRLDELTTPTLVIAGAADSLVTANLHDYLALPNATLEVLSHAGHEVAVHEPERVATAIDTFMTAGVVKPL